MPELDDDEYYDDATLAQMYRPVYAFGTSGRASQIGNVDWMSEEMQLETQMSLFNMPKKNTKYGHVAEKAEKTMITVALVEKMDTLMGDAEQMEMIASKRKAEHF
ncbi:hypothetical protein ONS95_009284 [Cadophora gregata]|uniref:uncharacterized protein n=1 Tax=Cadophora gregata TaxID=51156 RepID=UPI0026DC0CA0|nr:uncharacterized protein ONS95_009284 [Cadophora gregata]KAK0124313.1 hypothetical protein ONS95_009284 [Cadophora gregata]KAK0129832.1 hypothetical protein ONS96_000381 [Cadophora gregata f. sp. sojae]